MISSELLKQFKLKGKNIPKVFYQECILSTSAVLIGSQGIFF